MDETNLLGWRLYPRVKLLFACRQSWWKDDASINLNSKRWRSWCSPINVCIDFNLFLFQLNRAIVGCKSMPTEELSPSRGLDSKAQSCIRCKAGNNKKHPVVVGLQMELTGKVAVMVVALIERKPEGLSRRWMLGSQWCGPKHTQNWKTLQGNADQNETPLP